jgi:16S rRNA (cytosine967-C5)-methyltransferase
LSRYYSYINSAKAVIETYNGQEPLSAYLKKYFAANKKFGSKDRKQVSHLCYCYYRLGKTEGLLIEERILLGLFLSSAISSEILATLKPEWDEKVSLPLHEKLLVANINTISKIFPWKNELSEGVDFTAFNNSFLVQPAAFLRIRPGYNNAVKQKLDKAGIVFDLIHNNCIAVANSSKIDAVIALDKEAVIQDYSSQRIGELLPLIQPAPTNTLKIWDCCAASGGKSILAKDVLSNIELTVSDIRESILANLRKRFAAAGITAYKSLVMDLSVPVSTFKSSAFDCIICDAPCTGSGTWSRTPEQLFYFTPKEISDYAVLQNKIAMNALQSLKSGGYLLYITCSVFKQENEEVINTLLANTSLQLIKQDVFTGYDKKADNMFAALLQKP